MPKKLKNIYTFNEKYLDFFNAECYDFIKVTGIVNRLALVAILIQFGYCDTVIYEL